MTFSVSVWDFIAFACYALIFGFLVNTYTAKHADSTHGKALLFLTS